MNKNTFIESLKQYKGVKVVGEYKPRYKWGEPSYIDLFTQVVYKRGASYYVSNHSLDWEYWIPWNEEYSDVEIPDFELEEGERIGIKRIINVDKEGL